MSHHYLKGLVLEPENLFGNCVFVPSPADTRCPTIHRQVGSGDERCQLLVPSTLHEHPNALFFESDGNNVGQPMMSHHAPRLNVRAVTVRGTSADEKSTAP